MKATLHTEPSVSSSISKPSITESNLSMFKAELYKIRTHRTPAVLAGLLAIGLLIPSVVLVWYTPVDPRSYTTIYLEVFEVLVLLLGIVFGGWILGTEYRQDTVKRLLTTESRRGRVIATKAAVGASSMAVVASAAAVIGYGAARFVGSLNDVSVIFEGRMLLAAGVYGLASAVIAFGLSALTRSDSFAMIGTIALVLVLHPLLSLIPRVGQYSVGNAVGIVTDRIRSPNGNFSNFGDPSSMSLTVAMVTVAVWLGTSVIAGTIAFARRDV